MVGSRQPSPSPHGWTSQQFQWCCGFGGLLAFTGQWNSEEAPSSISEEMPPQQDELGSRSEGKQADTHSFRPPWCDGLPPEGTAHIWGDLSASDHLTQKVPQKCPGVCLLIRWTTKISYHSSVSFSVCL